MVFKCPKCGRDFKTTGTETMHEKFCKCINLVDKQKEIKEKKKEDKNIKKKEKKEEKSTGKKVECDHEYKILNSINPNEKKAIENGFSAYCKKCDNLI